VLAAITAWGGAHLLASRSSRVARWMDEAGGECRKVHVVSTSRVGGIAVAAGIAVGMLTECVLAGHATKCLLLLLCAVPAFGWGLIEDLFKRGAVFVRLALTAVSAILAFVLLDARITQLDVPGLDWLLLFQVIAFVFTVFAVTGVAHAMNVIDGLNGLSGITAFLASVGLAVVAWITNDSLVLSGSVVVAASVLGFLLVNFPRGRIFLGDGGAYLIGMMLAVLSVLLVQRNSEVSPWFPLLLFAYPVWETLFSMYRRRMRGRSTGEADALHLHTLVYRRLMRWHGFGAQPSEYVARNSLASMFLWILPLGCFAIALLNWNKSAPLQTGAALFAVLYIAFYRAIVQFRVPSWMVIRAQRRGAREELGVAPSPQAVDGEAIMLAAKEQVEAAVTDLQAANLQPAPIAIRAVYGRKARELGDVGAVIERGGTGKSSRPSSTATPHP
jgi:UDP-N-acetylmuramyl pentapeptide phosphotransferase/UDP-N-acetylglucosamine-1-phosphate transferase